MLKQTTHKQSRLYSVVHRHCGSKIGIEQSSVSYFLQKTISFANCAYCRNAQHKLLWRHSFDTTCVEFCYISISKHFTYTSQSVYKGEQKNDALSFVALYFTKSRYLAFFT